MSSELETRDRGQQAKHEAQAVLFQSRRRVNAVLRSAAKKVLVGSTGFALCAAHQRHAAQARAQVRRPLLVSRECGAGANIFFTHTHTTQPDPEIAFPSSRLPFDASQCLSLSPREISSAAPILGDPSLRTAAVGPCACLAPLSILPRAQDHVRHPTSPTRTRCYSVTLQAYDDSFARRKGGIEIRLNANSLHDASAQPRGPGSNG